jgi:hypothetical protein
VRTNRESKPCQERTLTRTANTAAARWITAEGDWDDEPASRSTAIQEGELRQTRVQCDRCGAGIRTLGSVLAVTAGTLRPVHPEPLDLCAGCGESFGSWVAGAAVPALPDPEMRPRNIEKRERDTLV